MSRSLSPLQASIPKQLLWICSIGANFASTKPGIVIAAQCYDLEMHTVRVQSALSMSDNNQAPTAQFSLVGATPAPGDAVNISSFPANIMDPLLIEPLLQFTGIVEQVTTTATGSINIICASVLLHEIPRVMINGTSAPVPVGAASITPPVMRALNHDITNGTGWGISSAAVSDDAVAGDVLSAVASAPGQVLEYLTHPDTRAANTAWKIGEFIPAVIDAFTVPAGSHSYAIGFVAPQGINLLSGVNIELSVYIGAALAQQSITASIFADNAGNLGAFMGSGVAYPGGSIVGAPVSITFSFLSSALIPGATYWLVVPLASGYGHTLGGSAAQTDAAHITYASTINGTGGVLTPIAFDWAISFKQSMDMSEMYAVPITISANASADKVGAWVFGSAFIGLLDALGNQIEVITLYSASLAYVEVPLSSQLSAGNYSVFLLLSSNASMPASVGGDNAAGDVAHVTKSINMATGAWSNASFDMAFHFSTKSSQVEWFLNAASLGVQPWQTDIIAAGGDIIVRASNQFGHPVSAETAAITIAAMPQLALGSSWAGRTISATDIIINNTANGAGQSNTPVSSGNIASLPASWVLPTSGPSFVPVVSAVAGAIRIYNTFDYSASGDQHIQIRKGAVSGALSSIVASGLLVAPRITANRWITVTLDTIVTLIKGETYWITSSNTGLGGTVNTIDVQALALTASSQTIDGVSVSTVTLSHSLIPTRLRIIVQHDAIALRQANGIRAYILALSNVNLDAVSAAALNNRYQTDALMLDGLLQSMTAHAALAEIDRQTRTLSTVVGNMLYLIDGDAVATANITPDDSAQLSSSSSTYGSIVTRVAYTYAQGALSGTHTDAVLESIVPKKSASMPLYLIPDSPNAAAAAIWRLALLGLQKRLQLLRISDMAVIPGDVVSVQGGLYRITKLRLGAPNECQAVEI